MDSQPMTYKRTAAQKAHDFTNARHYEEHVEAVIGVPVHSRFNAKDDLDLWHPGYFIEIKEKNQPLSARWHIIDGADERNLFVMDELTVRRACKWYPEVFFLLRDNAHDSKLPKEERQPRLFLAPIWELISVERARLDRGKKGKWVLDLSSFTRLASEADIPEIAHHMIINQAHKVSHCVAGDVPQVQS